MSFCHLGILVLSLTTQFYFGLSYFLMGTLVVAIFDKLGKGIVLREVIAGFGCLICLVMPVQGYTIFNREDALARTFLRFMVVPEASYFGFALPAMAAFTLAVCWPIRSRGLLDEGEMLQRQVKAMQEQLRGMRGVGITLMVIGVFSFLGASLVPKSIVFFVTLFQFASFAGVLYLFFSPSFPNKRWWILAFFAFIAINAIRSGVFTIVAYMGITLFSFLFMGNRSPFLKKAIYFAIGLSSLFLVQSVKDAYRFATWRNQYKGNQLELFGNLISDRLSGGESLFSRKSMFGMYIRANQGYNVSLVMRRIPRQQPYDKGNYLLISAASALVPRFLWPDKPKAGGEFNMEHYTGIKIRGWSTNIGPLGEAYGNFGPMGGAVFMFFLGLFIRFAYRKIFMIAKRIPLLILWIPVIFYQVTFSMETDSLQIFNSLFKSAVFVWLLYKLRPAWFGVHKSFERPIGLPARQPSYE